MALEIRQVLTTGLKQTQQLIMTPQLQQAIKLLQLTRMELLDKVQEEMEENPLLEEMKEDEEEETSRSAEEVVSIEKPEAQSDASEEPSPEPANDIDWEQYLNLYDPSTLPDVPADNDPDRPSLERYVAPETTLHDHLLAQLRLSGLEKIDRVIGAIIIGNLDDDGYLRAELEEIARMASVEEKEVERVLEEVQGFDPIGVASRDLAECLERQAIERDASQVVVRVIREGLKFLETKNYKKLAKNLGVDFEQVVEAAREISSYEPRPGRDFSSSRTSYVTPDVYVVRDGDDYVVTLNEEGLPKLRVSPYYKGVLASLDEDGKEAKNYIQERMQAAVQLIKSIQQRQQTLYKVSCSIVNFQRKFFDQGVAHLRPLILKDVADDIEMSESTVSRVTTGKYMATPQGLFELKFFFSSAIQKEDGGDLASRSVKARIKEVVSKENPEKPLSDIQIAKILFEEFGLKIARRTVSKYRESMGILPSSARRSYF